jgi:hypothetical protein
MHANTCDGDAGALDQDSFQFAPADASIFLNPPVFNEHPNGNAQAMIMTALALVWVPRNGQIEHGGDRLRSLLPTKVEFEIEVAGWPACCGVFLIRIDLFLGRVGIIYRERLRKHLKLGCDPESLGGARARSPRLKSANTGRAEDQRKECRLVALSGHRCRRSACPVKQTTRAPLFNVRF